MLRHEVSILLLTQYTSLGLVTSLAKCFDTEGTHDCAGGQKGGGVVSLADLEAKQDPTLELSHLIRAHRSADIPGPKPLCCHTSDNSLANVV